MNAPSLTAPMVSGVDPLPAAMGTPLQPAPLPLGPVGGKAVDLDCDGGRLSSDAGVVLRKDIDAPLGWTRHLAAVRSDPRDPRRIPFPSAALIQQRVLHIAAGDAEANDATPLRHDPLCTLLLDRLPASGAPWASQPTLSRVEHRVSRPALSRMALALLHQCIASSATPPKVIVLAVDDTADPVHGRQDQAHFEGYSGGYGLLPFHVYAGLSGRLITTLLQAKRFTGAQMFSVLKRLVQRLRHAWPATLFSLRGESHCASPEGRPWGEAPPGLHEVTGLTSQAVWKALARKAVEQATRASARGGRTGTRFPSTRYQAQTWARLRRVVIKGEVSAQGVNTRFVVTAMAQARTTVLSQNIYWARGQAEHERKAHTRYRTSERTSGHRVAAQQCRVWWHAAAYVLLET